MKIVIAPDSFKESLSALEVAEQIEAGFQAVFPDAHYVKLPVADGGEGTVDAMVAATGGRRVPVRVTGPLGRPVQACYGITGDGTTAVIEMAAASGLALVPPEARNPMKTTSFGTGELIRHALDDGLRRFIIGIGGSATNDGGVGMLQALGARFLEQDERQEIGYGGGALASLAKIATGGMDKRLRESQVTVACDVDNPLTGPRGASAIFGPQKGATPEMVASLDRNLKHFASLVKRDLQRDIDAVPGAGAAGGMGAALLAFLQAELRPGVEIVIEAIGLAEALEGADLVITGEGRIDGQTIYGKAPAGVARLAKRFGLPVIGFAGSLTRDAEIVHEHGLDAIFSVVNRPCSLDEAFLDAANNLRVTARNVAAIIKLAAQLPVS
jgi:glycerate kinase